MNKEEIDKFCREYYGFTLEDADGSIGYWMGKYQELEQENKELHNKIDKVIDFINSQSPDAGVSGKRIKEILKDINVNE